VQWSAHEAIYVASRLLQKMSYSQQAHSSESKPMHMDSGSQQQQQQQAGQPAHNPHLARMVGEDLQRWELRVRSYERRAQALAMGGCAPATATCVRACA